MWSRVFARFGPAAGAAGGFVTAPLLGAKLQQPSHCDVRRTNTRTGQVFPEFDASGFSHDEAGGFSLFLQERCQRIFLIRHAEGYHNLAERESKFQPKNLVLLKENSGYVYWDPKLTPRGEDQCKNLKASIRGSSVWGFDKPLNLDLVVVSPTTRTLQTACLSLGSPETPGAPPFIAHEGCREHISESMCDGRRSIVELKRDFPGVDFSLVETNEDEMFNVKETDEDCQRRGVEFLQWLIGRPEVRIAVVTHSLFLKSLLRQFGSEVAEEDREYLHGNWINAEMRSVMLCAHRKFESTLSVEEEVKAKRTKKMKASMWNGEVDAPKV